MLLAGCGASESLAPSPDAAVDVATADAAVDVTRSDVPGRADAPFDAERDAPADVAVDAPLDASTDVARDAAPADVVAVPMGPVLYADGPLHSPITSDLAAHLRSIAARGLGAAQVFSKIGDSITVSTSFLACFAGANVDLGGREALRPTLDLYRAGNAGGTDPFRRTSLAATVGWSASAALAGTPSPLARELSAVHPSAAVVMFGTNDIQSRAIFTYGANLLDIADQLLAAGAIPIFSSAPPRDDDAAADLWVPRYDAVARAVAQSRGVPFVDLHRALLPLPAHGLGPDHIHPNTYLVAAGYRACDLGPAGLRFGYNTRNLLTLEALHRLAEVTLRGHAAPDADAPRLAGAGTVADPFLVPSLPFADSRDTSRGGSRVFARYPCDAAADESGPEFVYRITVTRPTALRAMVITRGTTDVDLQLLDRTATAASCSVRNDRVITTTLQPGTWHLTVDTYVDAAGTHSGEYVLVLVDDG